MNIYRSKYTFGDIVYLVTDPSQDPMIITDVKFSTGPQITYFLSCGHSHSEHYEFEISDQPNQVIKLGLTEKPNDDASK